MFTLLGVGMVVMFFWAAAYNWRLARAEQGEWRDELYFYVFTSLTGGILALIAVVLDVANIRITDALTCTAIFIMLASFSMWIWVYKPKTELSAAVYQMTGTPQRGNRLKITVPLAALFMGVFILWRLPSPPSIATSTGLRPIAPYMIVGALGGVVAAAYAVAQAWRRRRTS